MPVELTERAVRDAVALLAEHEVDGAQTAQAALDWLGWDREGPLFLRRYDVQLFAWYTLPRTRRARASRSRSLWRRQSRQGA